MAISFAIGKESRRIVAIPYVDFFTKFSYSKTREKASAAKSKAGSKKNEGFLYQRFEALLSMFERDTHGHSQYLGRRDAHGKHDPALGLDLMLHTLGMARDYRLEDGNFWTKGREPTLVTVMTESSTSEDLVQQAKDGNVQAFGTLYDRTVRIVRAVAADAGPDADDVTHEAYLRAYRNLGSLREPARFSAWLVGITRMIVRETRKARRFEPLSSEVLGESPEKGLIEEDAEELLHAVARLPEEERLAIRFFFLNERSIDETATLLDRSRSGTYAVLQSAKAKLASWLRECGVDR